MCPCQLPFYSPTARHDQQLLAKLKSPPNKSPGGVGGGGAGADEKERPTQQFGVSLQYIKDNNHQDPIPPVLKNCITFLDHPDGNLASLPYLSLLYLSRLARVIMYYLTIKDLTWTKYFNVCDTN